MFCKLKETQSVHVWELIGNLCILKVERRFLDKSLKLEIPLTFDVFFYKITKDHDK